ncbi:MAG: hypothetical protein R3A47_07770 [Polyangiales bacterium]
MNARILAPCPFNSRAMLPIPHAHRVRDGSSHQGSCRRRHIVCADVGGPRDGARGESPPVEDVQWKGDVLADVSKATMQRDASRPIVLGERRKIDLSTVDAIFIWKDPPFDDAYLYSR